MARARFPTHFEELEALNTTREKSHRGSYSDAYLFAIGQRAYRIQTHILRIPPRYGLFSHGPARRQAMEVQLCVKLGLIILIFILLVANIVAIHNEPHLLYAKGVALGLLVVIGLFIKRRAVRYSASPQWSSYLVSCLPKYLGIHGL